MKGRNILSEEPMSMADVKAHLVNIKERDDELSFRAGKTEEYLNQFVRIEQKTAQKLYKDLEKMEIPRLKDKHLIKLVDLLPTTAEDVKIVLQGYPLTISNDNAKKVADAIASGGELPPLQYIKPKEEEVNEEEPSEEEPPTEE